jgi:hypothetical protein
MVNTILIRICELLPATLMNTCLRHICLNAEIANLKEGKTGGCRERLLTPLFSEQNHPHSVIVTSKSGELAETSRCGRIWPKPPYASVQLQDLLCRIVNPIHKTAPIAFAAEELPWDLLLFLLGLVH